MTEEERLSTFLNAHQEEIVNWVSNKVKTQFKVKNNMFDRTANLVNQEYPYGERIDNMHRLLTGSRRLGQIPKIPIFVRSMSTSSVIALLKRLI